MSHWKVLRITGLEGLMFVLAFYYYPYIFLLRNHTFDNATLKEYLDEREDYRSFAARSQQLFHMARLRWFVVLKIMYDCVGCMHDVTLYKYYVCMPRCKSFCAQLKANCQRQQLSLPCLSIYLSQTTPCRYWGRVRSILISRLNC